MIIRSRPAWGNADDSSELYAEESSWRTGLSSIPSMLPIAEPLGKDAALNALLKAPPQPRRACLPAIAAVAVFLTGCASERSPRINPADAHALIERSLPNGVADAGGWAEDIYTGFTAQGLE